MRKGGNDSDSSLELLLDTICNMFGGIVLIAIMVVAISQACGTKDQAQSLPRESETITPEQSRQQEADLARLKREIEEWEKRVGAVPTSGDIERARLEIAKLQIDVTALTTNTTAVEQGTLGLELAVKQAEDELCTLTNRLTALESEGREPPPIVAVPDMNPVFLAIMQGRLYSVHDVSRKTGELAANVGREYDRREVDVVEGPGSILITPRADQGQALGTGFATGAKMAQILLNIDAAKEILSFAVYADSFAEFRMVRDLIASKGYTYSWVPVPLNQPVGIRPGEIKGTRSGAH